MTRLKNLYVVHCVDTEGPLFESLEATFDRLKSSLGLHLEPNLETLQKIQHGQLNLEGKEDMARLIVSPEILNYNEHWGMIDEMLEELLSDKFRRIYADSLGNGWIFNWFIMDHVGYEVNPRRRDIGYLNIFDHYVQRLKHSASKQDELNWHFHPMSTYREGHSYATSLLRSPHAIEGLCRRIIDRQWFPSGFRAGYHTERPDLHWFLEQWIPFDFSNQALPSTPLDEAQLDFSDGRFGDWRRASADWSPYHPSHDDYQLPGTCHRTIFRCLNVGTRLRLLTQEEVDFAFARANDGHPTILAFADHDWRDMRHDVRQVHSFLMKAEKKFPEVKWRHSRAREAARAVLGLEKSAPFHLEAGLEIKNKSGHLTVSVDRDIFGPQPFLAIKTLDQRYLNDNFDFDLKHRCWHYIFDQHTVPLNAIETIGVAANSPEGKTSIVLIDPSGKVIIRENIL